MNVEVSLSACEATVRSVDPDRYISALFAPADKRPLLHALYAFNHELARIGETVKEALAADVRREWWRDAVDGARAGRPRHPHGVVRALTELFARADIPMDLFDQMIAMRSADTEALPFANFGELEIYADRTSGNVMRIAACILGGSAKHDPLLRHAGIAYGLVGLLRAEPVRAAGGKSFVPKTMTVEKGRYGAAVSIIDIALAHHAAARRLPKAGPILAAVLPASLAPLYGKSLRAAGEELFRKTPDVFLFRRQLTMLRAAIKGRV